MQEPTSALRYREKRKERLRFEPKNFEDIEIALGKKAREQSLGAFFLTWRIPCKKDVSNSFYSICLFCAKKSLQFGRFTAYIFEMLLLELSIDFLRLH